MEKGEIAHFDQFHLFPKCFPGDFFFNELIEYIWRKGLKVSKIWHMGKDKDPSYLKKGELDFKRNNNIKPSLTQASICVRHTFFTHTTSCSLFACIID